VELIPSIDLRGGRCGRRAPGDYARETIYDADPAAAARRFLGAGATRLHVVDLDGARAGEPRNRPAIREILAVCADRAAVQVGGGLRSLANVAALLELGAERVILGTAALEDPELLRRAARDFPGRVILGLDARDGRVAVRGWLETGELETVEVLRRFEELPLAAVLHTNIARDGMLAGPDVEGTAQLARASRVPVLASGGVGSYEDLLRLARERVIAGVVIGRALYTGAVRLADALRTIAAEPAQC
jgi:phosphoribosylformimino-5-aminoimidazole carboxamide ribotide isomerase